MNTHFRHVYEAVLFHPFKSALKWVLAKSGWRLIRAKNITHLSQYDARRKALMANARTGVLLDVGANSGQYAKAIRGDGYAGVIHSFEPCNAAFEALKEATSGDRNWHSYNFALGDNNKIITINVMENTLTNSILPPASLLTDMRSDCVVVNEESVQMRRLDDFLDLMPIEVDRSIMLKIDTQGSELLVLQGGEEFIKKCQLIEIELSLDHLYTSQALFDEVYAHLRDRGFALVAIEPTLYHPETSRLIQIDAIFERIS